MIVATLMLLWPPMTAAVLPATLAVKAKKTQLMPAAIGIAPKSLLLVRVGNSIFERHAGNSGNGIEG